MRTLLANLGRIHCRCRCYSCLDVFHVEFRQRLAKQGRHRSGRVPWQQLGTRALSSQSAGDQSAAGSEQEEESKTHWSRAWDGESGPAEPLPKTEETTWNPQAEDTVKDHEVDSFPEDADIASKKELQWLAHRLKSISIDHWSLSDLAKYEPKPGGESPPKAPSTSEADPDLMPPQSPWASDALKRLAYYSVWTPKKLQKAEIATATFALHVCRILKIHGQPPSNLLVLPEAIRPIARMSKARQADIWDTLLLRKRLLRARYGYKYFVEFDQTLESPLDPKYDFIPSYKQSEDGQHNDYVADLNTYLAELFEGYKRKEIDMRTLMLKICHNLLVSTAPPNVQTLNILLLGFYTADQGARHFGLVFQVLDSLVHNYCLFTKIRPNEITCTTILKSYRVRRMRRTFAHFISLMRGSEDRALMYTTDLKLTEASAPRLTPTVHQPRRFKQAVYPSAMIFSEIIKGVTTFFCLEDAMEICKELKDKEWGYDWSCLNFLLGAALLERNWEVGKWVMQEVRAFGSLGYPEPVSVLGSMMALCVQAEKRDEFAETLQYALRRHPAINASYIVNVAANALDRTAEQMSKRDLFAAAAGFAGFDASKWRAEVQLHEDRVKWRLDEDRYFREAVLGYTSTSTQLPGLEHEEEDGEDPEEFDEMSGDERDETAEASSDSVWPEPGDETPVATDTNGEPTTPRW